MDVSKILEELKAELPAIAERMKSDEEFRREMSRLRLRRRMPPPDGGSQPPPAAAVRVPRPKPKPTLPRAVVSRRIKT
jgi:hypothetical protein